MRVAEERRAAECGPRNAPYGWLGGPTLGRGPACCGVWALKVAHMAPLTAHTPGAAAGRGRSPVVAAVRSGLHDRTPRAARTGEGARAP